MPDERQSDEHTNEQESARENDHVVTFPGDVWDIGGRDGKVVNAAGGSPPGCTPSVLPPSRSQLATAYVRRYAPQARGATGRRLEQTDGGLDGVMP